RFGLSPPGGVRAQMRMTGCLFFSVGRSICRVRRITTYCFIREDIMKKIVLQVATLLGTLSCFGSVNAEEARSPLVPLPSIDDFTNGDGWGFGLGLGVEYESAYEGSDEFEFEIDPAGGVQWRTGEHIFF